MQFQSSSSPFANLNISMQADKDKGSGAGATTQISYKNLSDEQRAVISDLCSIISDKEALPGNTKKALADNLAEYEYIDGALRSMGLNFVSDIRKEKELGEDSPVSSALRKYGFPEPVIAHMTSDRSNAIALANKWLAEDTPLIWKHKERAERVTQLLAAIEKKGAYEALKDVGFEPVIGAYRYGKMRDFHTYLAAQCCQEPDKVMRLLTNNKDVRWPVEQMIINGFNNTGEFIGTDAVKGNIRKIQTKD